MILSYVRGIQGAYLEKIGAYFVAGGKRRIVPVLVRVTLTAYILRNVQAYNFFTVIFTLIARLEIWSIYYLTNFNSNSSLIFLMLYLFLILREITITV